MFIEFICGLMLIGDHGHYKPPYHLGTPQEERGEKQLESIERELRWQRKEQEREIERQKSEEREEEREEENGEERNN